MKVLAIGNGNPAIPLTPELKAKHMPHEVPQTLQLYLDGKIEQHWFKMDKEKPGVVFLMEVSSVDEAQSLLGALPLTKEKILLFDYLPLGPLLPLSLLIQQKQ